MGTLADDLAAETAVLRTLLADLDDAGWEIATPAAGWAIRDQVSHLAHFDDAAVLSATEPEAFASGLTAPDGELWTWDPEDALNRVTGPALDFCLLVTQRRHRADTTVVADGEVAHQWLGFAQAFAGPPGPGRAPLG